ncbi:TrbC/VirB2 family protein [Bartonella sp. ML70XJBT.G]|uniref:TrbC/VirB2 family protein n=1 Tax=Bartonella sp. ML70XJBT.G TaxID=3019093 RepID=UPI00235E2283|nr:TrbC/VirB2 family protein [Bartonella sp. ML70XJBT.G]
MTKTLSKNGILIVFMLLLTALILIEPSYAADTSQGFGKLDSVLKSIVDTMTGTTAKLIAVICVIGVGIAWMYGFFDLRKAAFVIIGIGIVFGAPALVGKFIG